MAPVCSVDGVAAGTAGMSLAAIAGLASNIVKNNIAKSSFIVFMEF